MGFIEHLNVQKTASYIDTQTVYYYVHTLERSGQYDCNRGLFSSHAGF